MAVDSVTYNPLQYIAGSSEVRSTRVTIPANQAAIPALTPLKLNTTGVTPDYKAVPATTLTDEIVGVLIPGPDSQQGALIGTTSSASDQFAHIYTHAELFGDMIDFTAMPTADSDLKKSAIFAATGINLVFAAAGQV